MGKGFAQRDVMGSKFQLEQDVDGEKKEEEREGAKPPAHVKGGDVRRVSQTWALPNQNLPDQETAQDEKQFDAIEPAMAENSERLAEMGIEDDEPVGTDHHHDRRGAEQIETEDAVGCGSHFFFWWPSISLCQVRGSTRVRCFSSPRLSRGRCGMSQRYSAMNQMSFSEVIQLRSSNRARFTGRE